MSGRVIVCGDVHGCFDEMLELVQLVEYKPGTDRLIFVGDLVDRGPAPRECVQWVKANAEMVIGNHEKKLVDFCKYKKGRTPHPGRLDEWQRLSSDELDWLDSRPLWIDLGNNWLVVHGGFEPVPLSDQKADRVIRAKWVDEKTGKYVPMQRVEVPENYSGEGVVTEGRKPRPHTSVPDPARAQTPEAIALRAERQRKRLARGENPTPVSTPKKRRRYTTTYAQPPGTVDWQKVWPGPQNVIYGHAAQRSGTVRTDYLGEEMYLCLGIDTACVYGNSLTAVILDPDAKTWYKTLSVKAKKAYHKWPEGTGP